MPVLHRQAAIRTYIYQCSTLKSTSVQADTVRNSAMLPHTHAGEELGGEKECMGGLAAHENE